MLTGKNNYFSVLNLEKDIEDFYKDTGLYKEWKMQNDWNSNTITLTKGLLDIKMFDAILGGQLDKN